MKTINSRDRSYFVTRSTKPYFCVACEAVVDLVWRETDCIRRIDTPEANHCPYCGAQDSLVETEPAEYSRHPRDEYEIVVVE